VSTRGTPVGAKGVWKPLLEQVSDNIDLEQLLLVAQSFGFISLAQVQKKKGFRPSVGRPVG